MNQLKKNINNLILGKISSSLGGPELFPVLESNSRWPYLPKLDRLLKIAYKPTTSNTKARKKPRRSPPLTRFWQKLTLLRHPNTLRCLLGLTIVTTWGCWNGKLLLSTALGVVVMVLVYRMQQWDWQVRWLELWRILTGSNRQLTLAVGCGAFATMGAYMSVSIWVDLENHWLASGLILQNLGLAAVIALVVWLVISQRTSQQQAYLERMLTNLTDADPLKRLIAVREITRWVINTKFAINDPNQLLGGVNKSDRKTSSNFKSGITRSHLIECFQMLLVRESEPTIRDAVIDGLQALDTFPNKINKSQSFSVSLPLKNYQIHGE